MAFERRSNTRKHWSPEDDQILKNLYGKHSRTNIAEMLGRTVTGVNTHAKHLNLTREARVWTEEDDQIVREHYGKLRIVEIAAQLNRTPHAVRGRISNLKLASRIPWTNDERVYLRRFYRRIGAPKAARKLKRNESSIRFMARRLGLSKRVPRSPWSQADLLFLRANISRMTHRDIALTLKRTE